MGEMLISNRRVGKFLPSRFEANVLSLPEEFELISFFESEPKLADPKIPWVYNNLKFETQRGSDRLLCEIEPAYGEMKIHWERDGVMLANLELNNLSALTVHIAKGNEYMIVDGIGDDPATLLKLRTKPFICIEFSCWYLNG
jgi:hypothetical protein